MADEHDVHLIRLLLRLVLREDSSCVDVGAHEGLFLRDIVRIAPLGHHHAVEPLPTYAGALRREFPGVAGHEVALGDADGRAEFHHVVTNPGYSGLRRRSYPRSTERVEVPQVPLRRLDDLVPAGTTVALLLEGRPYIVFEHGRGAAEYYGTTPAMLHDLLVREYGLAIFTLDGSGPLAEEAFTSIHGRGAAWNFIARPYRRPHGAVTAHVPQIA
jgi:FkbM family methyltransferase